MRSLLALVLSLRIACLIYTASASNIRHNVLHIIVDDLRPELGAYGLLDRHTPNIDRIAQNGTVFDRAYCQQAVCGPSRNSFMTGRRPDRSRSWNFINHFREDHPEWTTLPGLFLRAGSVSLASGKTYHPKLPPMYDGVNSWSPAALPYRNPCWNTADYNVSFQDGGLPCVFCPVDIRHYLPGALNAATSVANEFCEIDAYEDTLSVDDGIQLLRRARSEHFYLAVGLHKPHMPWQASSEDFAKHPLESVSLPQHPLPPEGMPDIAFHFTDQHAKGHDSPWRPVSDDDMRAARRAYRAAITGMDRKLGKLLDELDNLGIRNNTAIILHGDHGWQLGEHGEWRKMTNFEAATRVPLVISAPWLNSPERSAGLVELVDLAPTIAELAGLSLPEDETFDGVSLVPVLRSQTNAVKTYAFSQYPRAATDPTKLWKSNSAIHKPREAFTHMGYSIRTDSWRYTEWVEWNGTTLSPVWSRLVGQELYDHRNEAAYPTDFDARENENLASDPEHAILITNLSYILRQQFSAIGVEDTVVV